MRFSELTNSVLTTAGGNFTRAVYALTARFVGSKPMIFFCDGDAFGNDMLRTLEFGSQNSRHITLDQAFPARTHPNIHIAGLFPSVGERLGLPNDLASKRPMANKYVRERIDFMRRYNLVDERDIETWERNKTYELEALSTAYSSMQDGSPIGLGIHLVEYMRLNNIPCKPSPNMDEEMRSFKDGARYRLRSRIEEQIRNQSPVQLVKDKIDELFDQWIKNYTDGVYDEYKEELEDLLRNLDEDVLEQNLLMQYQKDPYREIFSTYDEIGKIFEKVKVDIDWRDEDFISDVEEALEEFNREQIELEHDVEFKDLEEPDEELRDFYDVVEEELGASEADCETVREAVMWRVM
jgi:hypothetical protein